MKYVKAPVTVRGVGSDIFLVDADGWYVPRVDGEGPQMEEIARVLNAHDALVEAAQAAYDLLSGWHPSDREVYEEKRRVYRLLCEALAKRGES